jgi:hypothetical protein
MSQDSDPGAPENTSGNTGQAAPATPPGQSSDQTAKPDASASQPPCALERIRTFDIHFLAKQAKPMIRANTALTSDKACLIACNAMPWLAVIGYKCCTYVARKAGYGLSENPHGRSPGATPSKFWRVASFTFGTLASRVPASHRPHQSRPGPSRNGATHVWSEKSGPFMAGRSTGCARCRNLG